MIIFMLVMLLTNIIFIIIDFLNTLRVHFKKLSRKFYNYFRLRDAKPDVFKRIAEFCQGPVEMNYN